MSKVFGLMYCKCTKTIVGNVAGVVFVVGVAGVFVQCLNSIFTVDVVIVVVVVAFKTWNAIVAQFCYTRSLPG